MSKKSFISKLTEEIKKLPAGAKFDTADDALEALRKAGVKDAELEYSGLRERLGKSEIPGFPFSKTALQMSDEKRPDIFDFKDTRQFELEDHVLPYGETLADYEDIPRGDYGSYTLPGSSDIPDLDPEDKNYREFIQQFSNSPEQRNVDDLPSSRSYSHHFQDVPNYQGHVRTIDEIWDGEPVLNVNEVQSDVLGHALQKGSPGEDIFADMPKNDIDRLSDLANEFPLDPKHENLYEDAMFDYAEEIDKILAPHTNTTMEDIPIENAYDFLRYGEISPASGLMNTRAGPGPDRMPNTKNYRERMLERAMDVAQSEGKTKMVVPLEDVPEMGRGLPIAENLHRGEHIQKQEYDPKKGRVPKALQRIAREQGMEYSTQTKDGVVYGVLDFKGKKKKPTELYSVGGLLGAGALGEMMREPDAGIYE